MKSTPIGHNSLSFLTLFKTPHNSLVTNSAQFSVIISVSQLQGGKRWLQKMAVEDV
jgi:hypothetical protein